MLSKRAISFTIVMTLLLSLFGLALQADIGLPADVQALQTIGMLKGPEKGITEEYTKTNVKRWQAAIILLRLTGNEENAINYTGTDNFADANLVDPKTERYLAYLYTHSELGMRGVGNDKFDPNSNITAKDYYKVMLHVLGYVESTDTKVGDFAYKDTLEFAKSKGLSKIASANPFTVSDMSTVTIEALKATVKSSSRPLIEKLIEKRIIDPEFYRYPVYTQ